MAFVYFQTFGCQMNVADSDDLKRKLIGRGFMETDSIHDADLVVVNTCSVREHAELRAKARIAEFAKIKKSHARLWVTGCMAQRLGDMLKKEITGIDLVIGAKRIDDIDSLLDSHLPIASTQHSTPVFETSLTSDFIPVMRGCNNYCAYCIVPYVRGNEISIPLVKIIDSIKKRVDEGIKEISLLGQNVNSYNDNGTDFSGLLEQVAAIDGLMRVRFTTSHPKDCSEKLIRTIADTPKLCHHIHLPVQAGSDSVLSAMNRKYSSSDYLKMADFIKKTIPDVDITTDILVGFPGETEKDFEATLDLVKRARFTTAFMFAYSVREGTAAAKLSDSVPKEEKLARLNQLIELQTNITKDLYTSMIGKTIDVLISGRQDKRDRLWMGLDNGCKRVLIACDKMETGTILNTVVLKSSGMTLIGKPSASINNVLQA